ncbi:hypothetical protein CHUAL_003740 [Chamberlinius hualienensis]
MVWYDFAAGCLAGSAGVFVGHPLDTLKVKLQTSSNQSLLSNIKLTYEQKKIGGFFRGMTFPLITSGFINSIFFGVYGRACTVLGEDNYRNITKDVKPSFARIYLAGCAGGLAQVGFVIPFELVKVKLQAETDGKLVYRGSVDCIRKIWKLNGIRGCYQGGWITVCRDVPSFGVYMVVYEWIKFHLSNWKKQEVTNTLIAGGIAGMVSWYSIIPFDMLKSRLQADDFNNRKYRGVRHCLTETYSKGGLRIFFKGSGLMVARAFPVNAAILLVYSTTLSLFTSMTTY